MIVPTLAREWALWRAGARRVAGVDEVGMACLAGPVVAAALVVKPYCRKIAGVRDSKTLSLQQRERLFDEIINRAAAVGVGAASVTEINELNILRASHLAMSRALKRVGGYDHALIDGREIKEIDLGPHTAIVDGDALSYAIAAASIVAKVTRDRLMVKLAQRYPGYGWEHNVGYATRHHLQGLREHGLTRHHRTGYAPVRTFLLQPTTLDDLIVQLDNAQTEAAEATVASLEEAFPALV
ncbi:MAG TPA: ribonuclease HII [Chloroflexota bacterium]|jgi:ribonuclease HII|nr:ribonuclease HII [Chloroflexota bacterium]